MAHYKNFILTLTLCLGASTAYAAEMSWLEQMRADPTSKKLTTHEKVDVLLTKSEFYLNLSGISLAALTGYVLRSIVYDKQPKDMVTFFEKNKRHLFGITAAVGTLMYTRRKSTALTAQAQLLLEIKEKTLPKSE